MWTLSKANEAKIPEWNKRWIEDVILRTKPMTPQDKLEVESAIRAMYRLVGLDGDKLNVVFVRSPMDGWVVEEAGGQTRTQSASVIPVNDITATDTLNPTDEATSLAAKKTKKTHDNSIYTSMSVYRATCRTVTDFTYNVTGKCTEHDNNTKEYGNFESSYCSYLSFVRDIIGFKCEAHKNYKHFETCAKLSGPRYMHPKFCVISDFPIELSYYTENGELVAHNDKGPSHLWSDGFAIWTINGIDVTRQIVLTPETLTIKQIDSEINEEVKRIMIERFTWARYITETNAKCLDVRINDVDGTSEALMMLKDKSVKLLCSCKSTARVYAIGVNSSIKNCQEAQSWMAGDKKINVIGVS